MTDNKKIKALQAQIRLKVLQAQMAELENEKAYGEDGYIGYGFGGAKFPGGLSDTGFSGIYDPTTVDYYSLRRYSQEQYDRNAITHNIINTKCTATIGTGLMLELDPLYDIIEYEGSVKVDRKMWAMNTEKRFSVWACGVGASYDYSVDYYELQRMAYQQYLLDGKVLAILRYEPVQTTRRGRVGRLTVQLIAADRLATPTSKRDVARLSGGRAKDVINGQAVNRRGTVIGYFLHTDRFSYHSNISSIVTEDVHYVPRWGNNGRLWVVDLTRKRSSSDINGYPDLTAVLQDLSILEQYRINELQSSKINAAIAVQSYNDTKPAVGGGLDSAGIRIKIPTYTGQNNENEREILRVKHYSPGIHAIQGIPGERLESFSTSRPNVNYADFAQSVIAQISAACGVPRTILLKTFDKSYSASRGELIEFYKKVASDRAVFGSQFCAPIFKSWLHSEIIEGHVIAPGWLHGDEYKRQIIQRSWCNATFKGQSKGVIDPKKEAEGNLIAQNQGWTTRENIARDMYNTNFYNNAERMKQERDALGDLALMQQEQEQKLQPNEGEEDDDDDS